MEPIITPFGISLAAGIVIEIFKSIYSSDVDNEIEKAFDEAINECVKGDHITKRSYEFEIKTFIREKIKQSQNVDFRNKDISGNYLKFFLEFEKALVKREKAYKLIREIRDNSRFQELKVGQEEIKHVVDEIKEQVAKFINQSNNTGSLKVEYLRQLNQYQTNLEDFNPSIALKNLLALEESFAKNGYIPDDIMKSNIELLKAKCYSLILGKKDDALASYIKAYNLNNNSNEAKELAAYAYFETGNKQKAADLIKDLLVIDEYNPIAWAIKTVLTELDSLGETLDNTLDFIIENTTFKRFLFLLSIKNKKFKDLNDVFENHKILLNISHFDNTNLTYQNYKERTFLVESIIQRFNKKIYINFLKEDNNKKEIKPYYNILVNFLDGVKNSELDNFNVVKFYRAYFDYLINDNKDSVYLMKDLYKHIENKLELYLMLVANSLQKEGDFDGAINLLNESEHKSETSLLLEMYCWEQKGNHDEYVKATKQYFISIKQISIYDSERLFEIIYYLKTIQKLVEFEIEEFIKDKEFETKSLNILFKEYIIVFSEKTTSKTRETLKGIKQEILSLPDTRIKYRLAKLFYILKEYEDAINIFDKIVDENKESEELYYYILSLYHGKINHKALRHLLVKWRRKFSLNLNLLKIEVELSFKLYEYDTIVEICQKFIKEKQADEFILTNYAIALYSSDKEYLNEFEEYSKLVKDFDFQHPNSAQTVAEILNKKSFHNEAFLIYYNSALKFPASKPNYLLINIPSELDKKYDEVQDGLFIQYETDGNLKIYEVKSSLLFSGQLIGKRINDKIEIGKNIGKHKQTIVIKAILNKYQALKFKIFNEVHENNPLSEIPMKSYDYKEHLDSGGNILDFIKDIVGENNYDENKKVDFEKYYKGELSFTEITKSYYSLNFVKAYYDLRYEHNGLFQILPNKYPYIDFNYYEYFILDFTSLLYFYEFTNKYNVIFNRRFVLPTSTKTIIKHHQSEMFICKGKNYLLDNGFYEGLLEWVNDNCEYRMSDLKLDVVSKIPNNDNQNIVNDYFVDTASLMFELNKSLLITDDVFYTKIFSLESMRIISPSLYIIKSIREQ